MSGRAEPVEWVAQALLSRSKRCSHCVNQHCGELAPLRNIHCDAMAHDAGASEVGVGAGQRRRLLAGASDYGMRPGMAGWAAASATDAGRWGYARDGSRGRCANYFGPGGPASSRPVREATVQKDKLTRTGASSPACRSRIAGVVPGLLQSDCPALTQRRHPLRSSARRFVQTPPSAWRLKARQ